MDIISRESAVMKGDQRYFTGEPCKHGHIAERYTVNTKCLGCIPRFTKMPKKIGAISTPNVFWAMTPFVFDGAGGRLTSEEMQAAIKYVQKAGWHNAALKALQQKS